MLGEWCNPSCIWVVVGAIMLVMAGLGLIMWWLDV